MSQYKPSIPPLFQELAPFIDGSFPHLIVLHIRLDLLFIHRKYNQYLPII